MKRYKHIFVIDSPTPHSFGMYGFLLFVLGVILVLSLNHFFDWSAMIVGVIIYICGGFSGRAFEKRNKENKMETGKDVSKGLPEKMG